ncbi:helix-turn-helix domain-containing protein [Sphaerotilus natans]|nr:helix-turn-helix domain-containing protein [Sphaerotilus natans]
MTGPTIRQHCSHDLDEHVEHLDGWQLRYEQLGRGRFEGRFAEVRLDGLQVFREHTSQPVRQRGTLMPATLGFAFVDAEGEIGNGAYDGHPIGPEELLCSHDGDIDLRTPPDCCLTGLVVDAAVLRMQLGESADADLAALPPGRIAPLLPAGSAGLRLRRGVHRVLAAALDAHDGAARLPDAADRLELLEALAEVIRCGQVPDETLRGRARLELVNRTCALMLEQLHTVDPQDTPTLETLARQIGTSARTLGYAFQSVLGLSPMQYLRTLRFNLVRGELRRSRQRESIYDIATRHGFWHFGHFSVDYRRQFGERPSDTLARVRPMDN